MTPRLTPASLASIRARCRAIWHSLALAALLASEPVHAAGRGEPAAGGISFGWMDCVAMSGGGVDHLSFGCGSSLVELPLFPGLVLTTPVDSVISMELVIDVDVAADFLPAWWRMDPGQCRAGGWNADAANANSCTDPWLSAGVASDQGWFPGQPGGSPRHGRLLVAVAAEPGTMVSLDAEIPYSICRVLLRTNNTMTCAGCTTPACLVFNSVLIRRLPGSSFEELVISTPEVAGSERLTWQGGSGADCDAVPTRRTTWGAVKSLYR